MLQYEMAQGILIGLVVNILRVVLMEWAMGLFSAKKDMDKKIFLSVYGIYYLVTFAAYCVQGLSLLYELSNFIGILVIACCYEGEWKKKLWTSVTWFCMELICLSSIYASLGKDINIYLKMAVSVLLFLISVTIVSHISGADTFRYAAFDRKQTLLLLVTPLASILALFSILYVDIGDRRAAFPICFSLLIINLSVFYLYHEMLKNYINLRERDRYRQQTELYRNQLEIIMESASRIRSLRHDMKNHIVSLQILSQNGSREEVQEYLQQMQEFMVNPSEHVMSGNEDIDSLLNYKLSKAKELLHTVEVQISIPEKLNLGSFDLNVILGNLLDNALEAAVQTEEKILEVRMEADRGVLFLNVSNSCKAGLSGGKIIGRTTKDAKGNHGIGLLNVRGIVEKHHGDMEIVCEHSRFAVEIMLYMKDL